MDIKNKIEEILLTDYQYVDCYTVDKLLDLFAVSGRSEQLVSFLQWYVKDEAQRENKELITSIVERYLNETNCH